MSYTIKITKNDREAGKLIEQIKELVGDSPFVSIYEDETGLSDDLVQELESRYQQVVKNPQEGKSWEEVKNKLEIKNNFHQLIDQINNEQLLIKLYHIMEQASSTDEGQLWSRLTEAEQIELLRIEQEVQSEQNLIPGEQMQPKHQKWL
jgi:photosystem II stability/assembly factor-like uncharacterized protein